jgi:predicted nucleotidyltransferase component of viral defense system
LSRKKVKNAGASVRAMLLNLAKKTGRDFDALLLQYCQERFLYRLSISPFKANFVLKGARKVIQLDIAYGDVISGGPVDMTFPVLMEEQPAPQLKVYSKESAIAEKFESLVKLNLLTSRMKDLYDILFMASHSLFKLISLHKAILSTFHHRMTPIENRKVIFEEEFKLSKEKQTQWSAFLKRNRLESFSSFSEAVEHMQLFIDPACPEQLSTSGKRILSAHNT